MFTMVFNSTLQICSSFFFSNYRPLIRNLYSQMNPYKYWKIKAQLHNLCDIH